MKQNMNIRVFNAQKEQIALSPRIKASLDSLGQEAEKSESKWDEAAYKMRQVLQGDNFDIDKLEPVINYYDTKKGKKILGIDINYYE
jgi:hypothetical protein